VEPSLGLNWLGFLADRWKEAVLIYRIVVTDLLLIRIYYTVLEICAVEIFIIFIVCLVLVEDV